MTIHEALLLFIVIHITCCMFNLYHIEDYESRTHDEIVRLHTISTDMVKKRLEILYEHTMVTKSISTFPVASIVVALIVVYLLLKD